MRKEQVSGLQVYILIITFMIGTTTAISPFTKSRQDTWISLLIALAVTTPVSFNSSGVTTVPSSNIFNFSTLTSLYTLANI